MMVLMTSLRFKNIYMENIHFELRFKSIQNVYFLAGILTTLRRCHLQIEKLDKLIFINKKWPSNLRIGCVKPIDLASTCEFELDLITKLEVEFHVDAVDHDDFLDLNEV
jgi:hypothetical protein